jgi:hypothetical protein
MTRIQQTALGTTACEARWPAVSLVGSKKPFSVRLWLVLALWMVASGAVICKAEFQAPTIHEVQAAFLFNFTKFITWPVNSLQRSEKSLTIGVLGDDFFAGVLEEILLDKTVDGKTLAVRRFTRAQDAANSHILFISTSQESHLPHIMKALEQTKVLTVSDMAQFAEHGGMVAFTLEDQRVRFKVNVDAVGRTGLKMGSQLLKLATIVGDQTPLGK